MPAGEREARREMVGRGSKARRMERNIACRSLIFSTRGCDLRGRESLIRPIAGGGSRRHHHHLFISATPRRAAACLPPAYQSPLPLPTILHQGTEACHA